MKSETQLSLQVVTTDDADGEQEKGFFSGASGARHSVQTLAAPDLGDRIGAALQAAGQALASAARLSDHIRIEKAEISLEITTKGEVRLIASGSLETKGAIKITIVPG